MEIDISIYNYGSLSLCNHEGDEITLGTEIKNAQDILTDKDFSTFVSDTITHEFLHALITTTFNINTSKLFDAIGHLFGRDKLLESVFKDIRVKENSKYPVTWHNSIITEGFDIFLQDYHINNIDLIQAYIMTGGK